MKELSNIFKSTKIYLDKHSPEILVGVGLVGMISTTILAVKATPKAIKIMDEEKKRRDVEELPIIDICKLGFKPYMPAIISGLTSTSCIIVGTVSRYKHNSALATAYAISERTLTTYKNKVIETIGEKKEEAIQNKIAQDKVSERKITDSQVFITEKGNTLCMDSISGRYFRSDIDTIKKIVNELNRHMTFDEYISLTDLYYELGLKPMKNSDLLGWNISDGLLDLRLSACLAENDEPCIVVDYKLPPKYDFDKVF